MWRHFSGFVEAANRHDAAAVADFFAADAVLWEPSYATPRRGRSALRRQFAELFMLLPDVWFTPETVLAQQERVIFEWTYRGTSHGLSTSRSAVLRECWVCRLNEDDLLADVRVYFDRLTLLRQLGLAPADAANAPESED
jgi:ketosteroid isomerase-like protein